MSYLFRNKQLSDDMENDWSLFDYNFNVPSHRFKLYVSVAFRRNPIEIGCEKIKNIFFSDIIHRVDIWRINEDYNGLHDYNIWFDCEATAALLTLAAI